MCVWTMQIRFTGGKKGGPPALMETANRSLEMEKRQIAISLLERDKGTFPKDNPLMGDGVL